MTIPPLLVFATAIGALFLIGGLIHSVYRLSARVSTLETWRHEFERVTEARMRAKNKALKILE